MSDPNKFTIHKYTLTPEKMQTVDMPQSAQVIHVDFQPTSDDTLDLCIWAMVLPSQPTQPRRVLNLATGEELPDEIVERFVHIKTIQTVALRQDGEGTVFPKSIVMHLFLERPKVN
jgi:hypothetical protein